MNCSKGTSSPRRALARSTSWKTDICAGGRRGARRIPMPAGTVPRRAGRRLWKPAHPAVVCRHAPARRAVPMLGLGMDVPLLDLAVAVCIPARSALCRHRVCARGLPGAGQGARRQRHHARVHVLLAAHGRDARAHGGAGAGGDHRLCRQGEHGPQRRRKPAGDDGRIPAETLRWLDACDGFRHIRPMLTPRFTPACTDALLAWLGALSRERPPARAIAPVGKPGGDGARAIAAPRLRTILGDLRKIRPVSRARHPRALRAQRRAGARRAA